MEAEYMQSDTPVPPVAVTWTNAPQPGAVYEGIAKVQAAMARVGIGKDRRNTQQDYRFRGIDDVFDVMAPIMADARIVFAPHYSDRQVSERETRSGGVLFYVTLVGRFRVTSTIDGSWIEVTTIGEAMDSGDKATNKAMSAALKYAAFQLFFVPVEGAGMADSETDSPEPLPKNMTRKQIDDCMDAAHRAFDVQGDDLKAKVRDAAKTLGLPSSAECTYQQGELLLAELRKFAAKKEG